MAKNFGPDQLARQLKALPTALGTASIVIDTADVELVATRLDLKPETVRVLTTLLSDAERRRASRFVLERDRKRFTVSRAWLRQLLAERLDTRPESVELTYCAHGKPSLAGHFADSDLQFNVSHCDDVAVVGLSRGRAIGVDIERVRAIPDADAIVACYFSRRENEAYSLLKPCDKPEGFFNCWTRKEAFIKAVGDGLSYPLHRFDVSLTPGEPASILRIMDAPGDATGWRLHNFEPGPGLVGAFVLQTFDDKFAYRV